MNQLRYRWIAVVLIAGALSHVAAAAAAETLSLAGLWNFHRDEQKVGVKDRWFTGVLPAPSGGPSKIHLPGSTDEAKAGFPNPQKPTLDGLYRPNLYTGAAWYQREVEIPDAWKGKRVTLCFERVHWVTQVWLDGKPCGDEDSLISPHRRDLGTGLSPGKHLLTVCVDNSLKIDLGPFVSILYEGTQTNWNGLIGRLELRATDPVAIDNIQVYPDVDHKRAAVRVRIANATGRAVSGQLELSATDRQNGAKTPLQTVPFSAAGESQVVETDLPMGDDVRLWDEFSPALYDLNVSLRAEGLAAYSDQGQATFGMRKLAVRGTQFTMNGRPLRLRGTLECAIFPRTGYPPCDVPAWQRIYQVLKSYGLNFIRFHSWCPPDAAFAAADIEGVMIQAEGPQANISAGEDPKRDAFIEREFQRMVDTYGNHPSFCLMTLGNEYGGKDALLSRWVEMLIRRDPRHIYSSASAAQTTANRQYTEGGPRGIHGPGTVADFRGETAGEDRPLMGHEIGQWTFYPNFDEIKKYTGVLEARNFELVRDDLRRKGMLDLAPRFAEATGKHAVLLYKEEIEVLLRTPGHAGFSLLDLHDYPGQGTALIGLLDPFWDSKGFIAPEIHARYCGPTVPLLRMKKREFTASEPFEAAAEVSHFGPASLANIRPRWDIRDEQGREVASGSLAALDVPTGRNTSLGEIRASLAKAATPGKLTVRLSLPSTSFENAWEIWVYPAGPAPTAPPNVTVSRNWDDATRAALAAGKKVILFPTRANTGQSLSGSFLPVFWSPVWFPTQKPNTMGILCDPKHPLFASFPTECHSNWQWYDLIQQSRSVILDDTPADFRPIVQVIDNFARNHKLGNLFEARVGEGRLLVCTMDLLDKLDRRPAAKQLLRSLYGYVASDRFQPAGQLGLPVLEKLLTPPVPSSTLVRLGAKIVEADSEDRENGNVAVNAIDGDPETIWHTRWQPRNDPMPHHLVVDLGREVTLQGITCLPRQDMANARIARAEIFCSRDRGSWGEPAARVQWPNSGELQTAKFKHAVRARYLKLVIQAEAAGNPFAAIAELDVILATRE